MEEKENKNQSLLNEKDNKINEFENIIKNNNDEISKLKKQINAISKNFNNEINKYKEKANQLEKKINKEYENITASKDKYKISEKKVVNNQFDIKENIDSIYELKTKCNYEENRLFQNDEYNKSKIEQRKEQNGICDKNQELLNENIISNEEYKIYGFTNQSSDCYLNSSLQLLTRINELKNGIYNYEKKYKINKENDTKGQLFIEFKKILDQIKNSSEKENLTINPQHLKNIMGKLDEKYYGNNVDANEFISNLIDGLLMETLLINDYFFIFIY